MSSSFRTGVEIQHSPFSQRWSSPRILDSQKKGSENALQQQLEDERKKSEALQEAHQQELERQRAELGAVAQGELECNKRLHATIANTEALNKALQMQLDGATQQLAGAREQIRLMASPPLVNHEVMKD